MNPEKYLIDYKKILIIRLSSLGDVILTTPLITALKQKFPKSIIDYLVKPQFKDVVGNHPSINNVYEFDKNMNYDVLMNSLIKNKYDLIIDLQNNLRSRRIASKLFVKTYRFKKPTIRKFLLVHFKWNLYKKIKSIPEMYFDVVPELTFHDNPPELKIPDKILPSVRPGNYIGLAPGSKHFTKMWPVEYFIELGKMLNESNFTILLFGGSDDQNLCSRIQQALPDAINLSTDNDLYQTARDMKECKLIVCNDSGLMHTAIALEISVVSIFGSTVKEFGFFPYVKNSLILENDSLNCRPCSHIGKDKCPKSHFKCMLELTPEFVFHEIKNFISAL